MTLEEKDLLLVNDSINTKHQHSLAVEKEQLPLDYSEDRACIKCKVIFVPLYQLRTELLSHSWPRMMNSLYRNEKGSREKVVL